MPDKNLGRIPPHSKEAEVSVLGSILIDNDSVFLVSEFLKPEHFYNPSHSSIYEAMISLYEDRSPIDLVTVSERLKKMKKLTKVGGRSYLSALASDVPTSANVESYGQIIKAMSAKRELISASARITEKAFDEGIASDEALDEAEQEIFSLSQKHLKSVPSSLKEVLTASFDRLDELQKMGTGLRGVPTGFKSLDSMLAGMQNSNLLILAARPGVGKTAFGLNMARFVSVEKKIPTCIFSLEMSKEELVDRLLVRQGMIDAWKLKTGKLSDQDFSSLSEAMGVLAEAPLYIDDTPGLTVTELRTKARRLQVDKGIKYIIVDYLQLMHGRTHDNRVQEVSEISQGLKNLARELRVPVMALAQLSRAMEQRGGRPRLSDLRESGCLLGGSLVTLSDGRRIKIEDLVGKKNIKIFGLSQNWKIKNYVASRVFYSGKKEVFELLLKSGRKIKASANHPFRKLSGWTRLDKLEVGDRLAVPRKIEAFGRKSFNLNKIVLLAHLIGDGCYLARQPLHYTNSDMALIKIVKKAAESEFNIKAKIVNQESWYHLYLSAKEKLARGRRNPIVKWLDEDLHIFDQRSGQKEIPEFVFELKEEQICLFLRHLWATDGCVHIRKIAKKGPLLRIYYASKSEKLVRQVSHLLLRMGIINKIGFSKKKGYAKTWHVEIQGKNDQMIFLSEIGCVGKKAKVVSEAIRCLDKIKSNPNNDVVPKEIWRTVEDNRKKLGWGTREFHKKMDWAYSGTQRHQNGVSRIRLKKIAEVVGDDLLNNLAESDVFWDEVKSIKKLGMEKVYDMTVPSVNNFVANDILVHNSIEQDADVVMFLHREDEEVREAVTCSIEKHRNGPIGSFKLYFNGKQISFFDVEKKE